MITLAEDSKAWDLLMSSLNRIEGKVDGHATALQDHRDESSEKFGEINDQLTELNGKATANSAFREQHSKDHGLLRTEDPDPEIAPTYMMAKRNPIRTILASSLGGVIIFAMIHPTPRAWLAKNFWSILKAVGWM